MFDFIVILLLYNNGSSVLVDLHPPTIVFLKKVNLLDATKHGFQKIQKNTQICKKACEFQFSPFIYVLPSKVETFKMPFEEAFWTLETLFFFLEICSKLLSTHQIGSKHSFFVFLLHFRAWCIRFGFFSRRYVLVPVRPVSLWQSPLLCKVIDVVFLEFAIRQFC